MIFNAFPLFVSYGQLVVFRPSEPLFNDWTKEHVTQGFAWREGSVSFRVPDHDGKCWIELHSDEGSPRVEATALRSIVVPFRTEEGTIMIGSVTEEKSAPLPPAAHGLRFALLPSREIDNTPYGFVITLTFYRTDRSDFQILRADALMSSTVLTKHAAPPYQ